MDLSLSQKEFRMLLDLVYIGNWVINSHRIGEEIIEEYNELESRIFGECPRAGLPELCSFYEGVAYPTKEYADGGIHDVIDMYDDDTLFELLAEELAMRDFRLANRQVEDEYDEFNAKFEEYMEEFEESGVDNLFLDKE